MTFLLDTHLLLWVAGDPTRLSPESRIILDDPAAELMFSTASIWEVVIKRALGRSDFRVDPRLLRDGLLRHGYSELSIRSEHALAVGLLPLIHNDPFDRILMAQAQVENITLLTMDKRLGQYPIPIQAV